MHIYNLCLSEEIPRGVGRPRLPAKSHISNTLVYMHAHYRQLQIITLSSHAQAIMIITSVLVMDHQQIDP